MWIERFNVFREGRGYFTDNRDDAKKIGSGERGMYECYLDIKKPFVFDAALNLRFFWNNWCDIGGNFVSLHSK